MTGDAGLLHVGFISMPGGMEWMLILLLALLLFGRNLPRVMRDIGRAVRSFKESMDFVDPVQRSPPPSATSTEPERLGSALPPQETQEPSTPPETLDGDLHD